MYLLLIGNSTVLISMWHGVGVYSTECHLVMHILVFFLFENLHYNNVN